MLAPVQVTGDLPPVAADTEHHTKEAGSNETPNNLAGDTPDACLADSAPMLPLFWAAEQDDSQVEQEDDSTDVWKDLNSASPSIQCHQCLWAYFNIPALSLADHIGGLASIFAQTDGFRSVIYVTSSLLHV